MNKYDLEGICQDCMYLEKIKPLFEAKDKEIETLYDKIQELEEYKKAIYEIKKYIDAYSPYFLETQEQNNQTIATIIHNIGDYNND